MEELQVEEYDIPSTESSSFAEEETEDHFLHRHCFRHSSHELDEDPTEETEKEPPVILYSDCNTKKYFLVKDMSGKCPHYYVITQKEGYEGCSPKYIESLNDLRPGETAIPSLSWCLMGAESVTEVKKEQLEWIPGQKDFIEVTPYFKKKTTDDIEYPDGRIAGNNFKRILDIIKPVENPIGELGRLIGLENVKKKFEELMLLSDYNRAVQSYNPDMSVVRPFLHAIFYGNPGTGKTTVARLYGSLLKQCGLLSLGHVVLADRNVLGGTSFGDEEEIVSELMRVSKGGVLMMDEAYLLEGVHHEDPMKMFLPLFLQKLADEKSKDFALILCGYRDKMDQMIEKNPGLYSRFVYRFDFPDFSLDELVWIGVNHMELHGHHFSDKALRLFRQRIEAAKEESKEESFGNARYVKNLVEQIYIRHANRIMKNGHTLDFCITENDITSLGYEKKKRKVGF